MNFIKELMIFYKKHRQLAYSSVAFVGIAFILLSFLFLSQDQVFWAKKINFVTKNEAVEKDSESLNAGLKLQNSLRHIAESITPSVVFIKGKQKSPNPQKSLGRPEFEEFFERFFGGLPQKRPSQITGSGLIVAKEGYILTNTHVVENSDELTVVTNDGKEYRAKTIGTDLKTDVAIIKISPKDTKLKPAPLGNSSKVNPGDLVVAIGSPYGFIGSMTFGIISASGRNQVSMTMDKDAPFRNYLQSDVAVNPGNSGGPLVNIRGQVVGINSAIFSTSGGSMGISFAIPINIAKSIATQLLSSGKVSRGSIGITIQPISEDLAKYYKLKKAQGALIASVLDGSSAQKAGLKAGDVILKINENTIQNNESIVSIISSSKPGSTLKITILRNGKKMILPVKINESEIKPEVTESQEKDNSKKNKIGISVMDLSRARSQGIMIPNNVKQGVIVNEIQRGGIAHRAGIIPGDIIVTLDNKPIRNAKDFAKKINQNKGQILIHLLRENNFIYLLINTKGE